MNISPAALPGFFIFYTSYRRYRHDDVSYVHQMDSRNAGAITFLP